MILYGGLRSPFVRRTAITLKLYGIEYDHPALRIANPEHRAELKMINPLARVPALVTEDAGTLVDSATILDYLDRLVGPEKALVPTDGKERTRVMALLGLAIGAIDKSIAEYYERSKHPEVKWHQPWMDQLLEQSKDGFEALEQAHQGPWLTGAKMTQADVSTVAFLDFARHIRPESAPALSCPNLMAMAERANQIPAFLETWPTRY